MVVIGAGPTGLACAIEAQRAGFKTMAIDKGCVVNSIYNYPANMSFFTTPELLEIGDIPFSTARQKPTREEALEYYRKVAEHYDLDVRQYQWVKTVTGSDGNFQITATDCLGRIYDYRTRKLIVSTGYYDLSNPLNIPGEDLAKVFHYYREPHPFFDMDVRGDRGQEFGRDRCSRSLAARHARHPGSSRLQTAQSRQILDPAGHREPHQESAKLPLTSAARWSRSESDYVNLDTPEGPVRLKNDFVFAMTGYHPDYDFLRSMGIELSDRAMPSGVRSADPGEQCARNLCGGSDRGGIENQRNLYRERKISRPADRRRI